MAKLVDSWRQYLQRSRGAIAILAAIMLGAIAYGGWAIAQTDSSPDANLPFAAEVSVGESADGISPAAVVEATEDGDLEEGAIAADDPEADDPEADDEEVVEAPTITGPVTVELENDGIVEEKNPDNLLMPPDIAQIIDRGELIVATRGVDTPPFVMYGSDERPCQGPSFEQDGQTLCGLDIEIGMGLADRLGVGVRFDTSTPVFNEVVEKVYKNEADLALSKLSISMSRAARMGVSNPYVNLRQGVLLNRVLLARAVSDPNVDITDAVRTLPGRVGVIENTQYGRFASQLFPQAEVVEFPSWDATIEALVRGDLLGALRDEMEVKKVVLSDPRTALLLKTAIFTDTQDLLAAMVAWNKPQLRTYVNQYLLLSEPVKSADDIIARYPEVFQPAE